MEITDLHKNGTVLRAIKTFDELTKEEKARLILPAGNSREDYATYKVHYNKRNELLRVLPETFRDDYFDNKTADLVDVFKEIEKAIKNDNVDRETAYNAAFNHFDIDTN